MELSYLLLLVTCILYGASGMIAEWRDFPSKLVNALVIIVIIVLLLVTLSPGHAGFFRKSDDFWWIDFLMPIPAIYLGGAISSIVDDNDWTGVFFILGCLSLLATIVTTCCGL